MELEKYIDKKKALDYIVKEATKQEISLNELSKGIYDSSNFYKMCNGKYHREINFEKLILLCNKLSITIDELVKNCTLEDVTIKDELEKFSQYAYLRDYQKLRLAVNRLRKMYDNPLPEIKQYILWHEAICLSEIDKNYEKAIEKDIEAIRITVPSFEFGDESTYDFKEEELRIFCNMLIAINLSDKWDSKVAMEEYRKIIAYIEANYFSNSDMLASIYYNAGLTGYRAKAEDRLEIIDKGIDICINKQAYLYLPFLYYVKACYVADDDRELGIDSFEKSSHLFELQNNFKMVNRIKEVRDITGLW
ncbi:MAG: hypothetical protein IKM20_07025 [Erysipelotrichales bacterium]|nr:hypothetical protein [Erysipelotrichales bacterium]